MPRNARNLAIYLPRGTRGFVPQARSGRLFHQGIKVLSDKAAEAGNEFSRVGEPIIGSLLSPSLSLGADIKVLSSLVIHGTEIARIREIHLLRSILPSLSLFLPPSPLVSRKQPKNWNGRVRHLRGLINASSVNYVSKRQPNCRQWYGSRGGEERLPRSYDRRRTAAVAIVVPL